MLIHYNKSCLKYLFILFIWCSVATSFVAARDTKNLDSSEDGEMPITDKTLDNGLIKLMDSLQRYGKINNLYDFSMSFWRIAISSFHNRTAQEQEECSDANKLTSILKLKYMLLQNLQALLKEKLEFKLNMAPKDFRPRTYFLTFVFGDNKDSLSRYWKNGKTMFLPLADRAIAKTLQSQNIDVTKPSKQLTRGITKELAKHTDLYFTALNARVTNLDSAIMLATDAFYAFMVISPFDSAEFLAESLYMASLIANFILMKAGYYPIFFDLFDRDFSAKLVAQIIASANASQAEYIRYGPEALFNNANNIPLYQLIAKHMRLLYKRQSRLDTQCIKCGYVELSLAQRKLKKCSRCKIARYCSHECQLEDWQKHKLVCKEASEGNQPEDSKQNKKSESTTLSSSSSSTPAAEPLTSSTSTPTTSETLTANQKKNRKKKKKNKEKKADNGTADESEKGSKPDPSVKED